MKLTVKILLLIILIAEARGMRHTLSSDRMVDAISPTAVSCPMNTKTELLVKNRMNGCRIKTPPMSPDLSGRTPSALDYIDFQTDRNATLPDGYTLCTTIVCLRHAETMQNAQGCSNTASPKNVDQITTGGQCQLGLLRLLCSLYNTNVFTGAACRHVMTAMFCNPDHHAIMDCFNEMRMGDQFENMQEKEILQQQEFIKMMNDQTYRMRPTKKQTEWMNDVETRAEVGARFIGGMYEIIQNNLHNNALQMIISSKATMSVFWQHAHHKCSIQDYIPIGNLCGFIVECYSNKTQRYICKIQQERAYAFHEILLQDFVHQYLKQTMLPSTLLQQANSVHDLYHHQQEEAQKQTDIWKRRCIDASFSKATQQAPFQEQNQDTANQLKEDLLQMCAQQQIQHNK